jgi:altronate hydrolase
MSARVLQLDLRDNVLIALTDLQPGEPVAFHGQSFTPVVKVPAKHKFATRTLDPGDNVVMYGVVVGKATKRIAAGELLTVSNLQHQASPFREQSKPYSWSPPDVSRWQKETFLGYHRSDGQVGTRNYWLVVPLVFCENKNIQVLKQAFEEELGFAAPQPYRRQVAELVRQYRNAEPNVSSESNGRERLFKNLDASCCMRAAAEEPRKTRRICAA